MSLSDLDLHWIARACLLLHWDFVISTKTISRLFNRLAAFVVEFLIVSANRNVVIPSSARRTCTKSPSSKNMSYRSACFS